MMIVVVVVRMCLFICRGRYRLGFLLFLTFAEPLTRASLGDGSLRVPLGGGGGGGGGLAVVAYFRGTMCRQTRGT